MSTWADYLEEHRDRFLTEMLTFLRIPSVSSLPDHAEDVRTAAQWVIARLTQAGVEGAHLLETGGHPVVYGEWLHAPGKPTVLIYGHFDVQPVDPVSLWTRPPFDPIITDGRIYARGASDDKGNMLIPILAVEALLKTTGKLPINVKFFLEGQEEIGSPQLPTFVAEHADLLACDFVVSSDGGQYGEEQPSLTVGAKGLCALQIDVTGAKTDLHSGRFGGSIQNPIHALVSLLDSMRGPDGQILVEGFFDTVVPMTPAERAQFAAIPFTDEEYTEHLGVNAVFGEPGYTTVERRWSRPTIEVNGIWGGFQGEGTKTVLPNQAHAKITCRLVADQKPEAILGLMEAHIAKHAPLGVLVNVTRGRGRANPYLMAADHPVNAAAAAVLTQVYGKQPFVTRSGGTIPVCELFQTHLGAYTIMFAFGLDDENIHAPDEFFRLKSWDRGQEAYCLLLERLSAEI